jgi:hypothetical protein
MQQQQHKEKNLNVTKRLRFQMQLKGSDFISEAIEILKHMAQISEAKCYREFKCNSSNTNERI